MTFVVSGGAGFVGLNIAEAGLRKGEDAVIVSNTPVPPNAVRAFGDLPGKLHVREIDVRDAEAFGKVLAEFKPTILFPFAAITPGKDREDAAPESVIEINVVAVMAQLRAARDAGVARIVVPASGAVYGANIFAYARLDEQTTPCVPDSIYATSKYAVETSSLRLADIWNLDVKVARIGSVFGPWEHESGARQTFGPYFKMLEKALAGKEIVLPERFPHADTVYSRDLADALWHLAAQDGLEHRVFNVSTDRIWADDLPKWAKRLSTIFPSARWRTSSNLDEVNVNTVDSRNRGLMDTKRLASTGWTEHFAGEAAHVDFEQWIRRYLLA